MQRKKLRTLLAVDDVRNLFVEPLPVLGRQRLFRLVDKAARSANRSYEVCAGDEKQKSEENRTNQRLLLEPAANFFAGAKTVGGGRPGGLPPPV
jgi:hypothetical protein